jgi:hypothetical protein
MKALSIKEPFASELVYGNKTTETRSWACPKKYIGTTIFIHASKKPDKNTNEAKYIYEHRKITHEGCVIGMGRIKACRQMTKEYCDYMRERDPDNYKTGFYEPGRYAWEFENIVPLEPTEKKGKLGLWEI